MSTNAFARKPRSRGVVAFAIATIALASAVFAAQQAQPLQESPTFRFKSGVELINVTATVTDDDGRFAPGLRQEDFRIYEDGVLQEITHFSNERVPVSLGIALDASGSMTDEKMSSARNAIDRFVFSLLGHDDELFFEQFSSFVRLTQGWTTDRSLISRAVRNVRASGGTALYDAVQLSVSRLKAMSSRTRILVLLTDGRDVGSRSSLSQAITAAQQANVVEMGPNARGAPLEIELEPRLERLHGRRLTVVDNPRGGQRERFSQVR